MIIGGDNISVDLHGHAIIPGELEEVDKRGGVEIFDRRGVTIKNGTIDGYDYGLLVVGGGGHTFRNLDVKRGSAEEPEQGVFIQDVDHTVVKRVSVTPYFDRTRFFFSGTQSQISRVRSTGDEASGAAIVGQDLLITHNQLAGAQGEGTICGLFFRGERSTIRRNKLSTGAFRPSGGALCLEGNNNLVKNNSMIGAATGLTLSSTAAANVIRNNYIRSNPGPNVPDAIDIRGGANACGNTWKNNNFKTDSEGDGPHRGCIR
jgi:nitrous oxidase accessory protein NosD